MATRIGVLFADLVRTFTGGELGPSAPQNYELEIPIEAPIALYADTPTFRAIDRLESYFRKQQHAHKLYDWNGSFAGYNGEDPLPVGYYVPYGKRRPSARKNLAAIIVRRFTAMMFGEEATPVLKIEDDEDAEAGLRALVEQSDLFAKMIEARDLGGATKTACVSFAFVEGLPRLSVHNRKHVTVLEWEDETRQRPLRVLKTYRYEREVWDPDAEKLRTMTFYYARYWDTQIEIVWEPIPEKLAKMMGWSNGPKKVVKHDFGWCPFYWIPNTPDSEDADGEGDYEGLECNLDEIDELLSAGTSGTKANVDPTLVVHMDIKKAPLEGVRKGSGNAIFSEGGAEYLELKGQAMAAARDQLKVLCDATLDAADCVIPDPEKITGNAQSGRALAMLYAPMTSRASVYRTQYGKLGIVPIARDMLRIARRIESAQPVEVTKPDGAKVMQKPSLLLPKRKVPKEKPPRPVPEMGERVVENPPEAPEYDLVEHTFGASEDIKLDWPPFFPVGWPDIAQAVTAAQTATGGKPVLSQKSAVAKLASMFGTDPESELHEIEMDSEKAMDNQARQMAMMPPPPGSEEEPKPPGPPEKK